jgi:hypothetical protein
MGFRVFSHTLATYAPFSAVQLKLDHISKNPQHQPDGRVALVNAQTLTNLLAKSCAPPLS